MATKITVNIGVNDIVLETEFGLGFWARNSINFDYGNWSVYIKSNRAGCITCDLILQFTDDGKVIFSCNSYHFNEDEECDKRNDKEDTKCYEYKNLEITDNYSIKNKCFYIDFVKGEEPITKSLLKLHRKQ
ncbi:MAG: hypothetical protein JHC31_13955 [Sulfurihydrogenibium sp.]|jgi:hypothetical protein|nr:hypothetical protein [Sulfurihydrogenibium sp.]